MKTHNDTGTKETPGIGWLGGTVGGLLLIGLGLELLAHQTFGQTDVATLLLAVYLAVWLSILGIFGFIILAVTWLVRGRRAPSNHTVDLTGNVAGLHGEGCSRPA